MSPARTFTLLIACMLLTAPMHAQRGTMGMSHSGVSHFGAGPFPHEGSLRTFPRHSRFRHFNDDGAGLLPLWYADGFGYYNDAEPVVDTPLPITVRVEAPQPPVPLAPAATPMIIEVPGVTDLSDSKARPPAVFILTNGEQVESTRYVLTADRLHITVEHRQRTFPLAALNVEATVAANRQRGIELRIPLDRNEITLGF